MVNAQEFRLFIGYEASHKQLMKDSAYMYIVLNTISNCGVSNFIRSITFCFFCNISHKAKR